MRDEWDQFPKRKKNPKTTTTKNQVIIHFYRSLPDPADRGVIKKDGKKLSVFVLKILQ